MHEYLTLLAGVFCSFTCLGLKVCSFFGEITDSLLRSARIAIGLTAVAFLLLALSKAYSGTSIFPILCSYIVLFVGWCK